MPSIAIDGTAGAACGVAPGAGGPPRTAGTGASDGLPAPLPLATFPRAGWAGSCGRVSRR